MKIWVQSATAIGVDPLWRDYEESLRSHVRYLAREGSEINFSGVKVMTPDAEKHYYFRLLMIPQIVENAIRAEKEGFDVFALSNMYDLGLHEVREVIQIPSVFMAESSLLLACTLGGKFSLISHNPNLLEVMNQNIVQRYGLEKRAASPQTLNIAMRELAQSFKNPSKLAEELTKVARKAVESGAEILVPTSNVLNMFCVSNGIKEIQGVIVLDVLSILIKSAEMMVDLREKTGLSVSRRYHYCKPDKELLASVRKAHHLV